MARVVKTSKPPPRRFDRLRGVESGNSHSERYHGIEPGTSHSEFYFRGQQGRHGSGGAQCQATNVSAFSRRLKAPKAALNWLKLNKTA
eukprot:11769367-Alexandrium_andersonii.AAC.2